MTDAAIYMPETENAMLGKEESQKKKKKVRRIESSLHALQHFALPNQPASTVGK
jgi:hypothetical protein